MFESYIKIELGLSSNTVEAYLRDVDAFFDFMLMEGLQDFTLPCIEDFVKNLQKDKSLCDNTIRRKLMSARALYRCLADNGVIDGEILTYVSPVRRTRKMMPSRSPADIEKMIAAISGPNRARNTAIILLLSGSGLRVSELCSLKTPDFNSSNMTLRVFGKGGQERLSPFTQAFLTAIREYLAEREDDLPWLFVKQNLEGPMSRRSVSAMVTALSVRAGVKHTTSHTLRRSFATAMMDRGVDLIHVKRMLGHKDLGSTQSYLIVDGDKLRSACDKFHPAFRKDV